MFYDVFKQLCEEKGISPTKASTEIGFSKGSVSYWKKRYNEGNDAKPDSYTAAKIADYFGVSVDYLLCRTDDPTDYANGDLIASVAGPVLDEFDGDVRKAIEFQKAVAEDAAREYADRRDTTPSIIKLYEKLDEIDKAKAEAYITGLLAAEKYTINSEREYNLSLVAARSSNNEAIHIENLPDLKKVTSNDTDF